MKRAFDESLENSGEGDSASLRRWCCQARRVEVCVEGAAFSSSAKRFNRSGRQDVCEESVSTCLSGELCWFDRRRSLLLQKVQVRDPSRGEAPWTTDWLLVR